VEAWQRLAPPDEPAEITALRTRVTHLLDDLATAARERGSAVQHLVGLDAVVLQMRRIAPAATRSVWVMQPEYAYDPEEPGVVLARGARLRGVEPQLITRPITVRTHPLLPSIYPSARLGPTFLRAMVIDGRQAMVGGPDDAAGQRTSWYTTIPHLVQSVTDLWRATEPLCRPILPPGEEPPLTERQLEVARRICVGEDDDAIAEALRVPVETVEREVRNVLDELGARSRTEAVLIMRGRGVNGGWRNAYA
jgi:DNA-binding CsgD family transcriptional regulator